MNPSLGGPGCDAETSGGREARPDAAMLQEKVDRRGKVLPPVEENVHRAVDRARFYHRVAVEHEETAIDEFHLRVPAAQTLQTDLAIDQLEP
jgi:hypothetical protein